MRAQKEYRGKTISFKNKTLSNKKITYPVEKTGNRKHFYKRLSPFLMLAFFLPMLFAYLVYIERIKIHAVWIQLFVITFLEVNILFTDFALWNYYEGKRKLRLWLIEASVISLAVYFL